MKEARHTFPSDGLKLEALCAVPDGPSPFPAVVVCHPHPQYGGAMYNKVVHYICRELAERGILAFRFNFRGAGNSEGEFAGGKGELTDAAGAVTYVEQMPEVDRARIAIAGYSFGASVAITVFRDTPRLKAIAAVSPPRSTTKALDQRPKLVIVGDLDDLTPLEQIKPTFDLWPEPKELQVLPGPDHFYQGYEELVGKRVASFFEKVLKETGAPAI